MTAARLLALVVGLVVAAGYFRVFHAVVRKGLAKGQVGRFAFIVGVGVRQLGLAAVIAALWKLGLDWAWLIGGLLLGVMGYRLLLLRGWPATGEQHAFSVTDESAPLTGR